MITDQPIGEHLLNDGLGSSQHQLRVLRSQTLLHQLQQQRSGNSKLSFDDFLYWKCPALPWTCTRKLKKTCFAFFALLCYSLAFKRLSWKLASTQRNRSKQIFIKLCCCDRYDILWFVCFAK